MSDRGIVKIGNAHGKIAVYFDKEEALDLARLYGPGDKAHDEILGAVRLAYPAYTLDDHASDQAARRYENHLEQIKDRGP